MNPVHYWFNYVEARSESGNKVMGRYYPDVLQYIYSSIFNPQQQILLCKALGMNYNTFYGQTYPIQPGQTVDFYLINPLQFLDLGTVDLTSIDQHIQI